MSVHLPKCPCPPGQPGFGGIGSGRPPALAASREAAEALDSVGPHDSGLVRVGEVRDAPDGLLGERA